MKEKLRIDDLPALKEAKLIITKIEAGEKDHLVGNVLKVIRLAIDAAIDPLERETLSLKSDLVTFEMGFGFQVVPSKQSGRHGTYYPQITASESIIPEFRNIFRSIERGPGSLRMQKALIALLLDFREHHPDEYISRYALAKLTGYNPQSIANELDFYVVKRLKGTSWTLQKKAGGFKLTTAAG